MGKKLKLQDLKVQSLVTSLNKDEVTRVKGGALWTEGTSQITIEGQATCNWLCMSDICTQRWICCGIE